MNKNLIATLALSLAILPMTAGAPALGAVVTVAPKVQHAGVSSQPEDPIPVVCFYVAENMKGRSFCEAGERAVSAVPAPWRNQIKSVSVSEEARVRICPVDALKGECTVISQNTKKLQTGLFNHVFSYDIRQD